MTSRTTSYCVCIAFVGLQMIVKKNPLQRQSWQPCIHDHRFATAIQSLVKPIIFVHFISTKQYLGLNETTAET